MKKLLIATLAAAVVGSAWVPAAFAGIQGSRHDMTNASAPANLAGFADYGACSACHIPHGAQGARLFPNVGVGGLGGFFGPLCQTCHDNSIAGGSINIWTNDTALVGHGLVIANITGSDTDNAVDTSGLPYTTGDAPSGAGNIECLSCHDVHNTANNFRPFLQESLDDLCEDCHTNRVNNNLATTGYANAVSTHPAGPVFTGDVSGIATAPNSPFVAGWGTEFASNPDTGANGSTWTDAVWNSGLQLSGQGAAGTGGVDCISCHNVHWDENDATPANGTAYLGIVADNLGGDNNTFCEYCHRGANVAASTGGYYWNPGNTNYSHPNDDVAATNATITADMTWQPATTSAITGTGASGLVCTSCHGVHMQGGAAETEPNSPILLNYDDATYNDICSQCHNTAFAFNHHPTGGNYVTAGNTVGGVTCAGGDLAPGIGKCHGGGTGAGIAHNRLTPMNDPQPPGDPERCQDCHSGNPSTYTPGGSTYTADGLASHFIGDAEGAGVTWTNGRTAGAAGSIRYAGTGVSTTPTTNWVGSGLPSKFGANATTMICQSCHRLASGNVQSGDGNTMLLVEVSGSQVTTVTAGTAGSAAYTNAPYICTGCHLVPGGTHPLEDADGTQYPLGTVYGQSYNANTTVNCESCHSPHDAETTSGSYILDGSGTAYGAGTAMEVEPTIDYTTFCAVCHGAFD